MTSMPNRIVLASAAVLMEEPDLIDEVLKFLENFCENYFGGLKETKEHIENFNLTNLKISDGDVTKKIMKYVTNLDDALVKELLNENMEFFSVYNDIDYDETIYLSLNGNSLQIPIKSNEMFDRLEDLMSMELRNRGERLYKVARENSAESDVARNVLAYSFIERKLLVSIEKNLSNLLSISTFEFPHIQK